MAIIPLDDWIAIVANDPVLDAQQVNDIRESMHAGVFDDIKLNKIYSAAENINWTLSHVDLWRVFKTVTKNYLFDDDAPDPEPPDYVWDVITKQKGDLVSREIDKIGGDFPLALRNETLIEIGLEMGGNLSTKLQAKIDLLNA